MSSGRKLSDPRRKTTFGFPTALFGLIPKSRAPTLDASLCKTLMPFQFSAGFDILVFYASSFTRLVIAPPSERVRASDPIRTIGRLALASFSE